MKLGAFLIATTMAGRADKRGKSGRRDMSNERYIWQSPRCMVNEALCDPTCNIEINQEPFKNSKMRFTHENKRFGLKNPWVCEVSSERTVQKSEFSNSIF